MSLKSLRLKAGLTQKGMSEQFDIPLRTITNWEQGLATPPPWAEKLLVQELKKIIAGKVDSAKN